MQPRSAVAFLLLTCQVLAWTHVVNRDELQEAIALETPTLVTFVVQDEDRSEALGAELASAKDARVQADILTFDCAEQPNICAEYGVNSVPALRLFRAGKPIRSYRGARKAASIASFLRRSQRPVLSTVTETNVTSFAAIDDVVIVGRLAQDDAGLRQRFARLADKYGDRYSFAIVGDCVSHESVLECYNNADDMQTSIADLERVEALEEWVKACATPLIPELTRRNELQYYGSGKSIVHYFAANEKDRLQYVAEMRPLAKKYQEYLQFTTTDVNEYPDAAAMMGLRGSSATLSVQVTGSGNVFPFMEGKKLTAPAVEEFLGDIISGKMQPWREGYEGQGHDEL